MQARKMLPQINTDKLKDPSLESEIRRPYNIMRDGIAFMVSLHHVFICVHRCQSVAFLKII